MIRNTFRFLPGIGDKIEKQLWGKGILTWEDFLTADRIDFISADNKKLYDSLLTEAWQNLHKENYHFFADNLKRCEHWRLFKLLRDRAVALDIETDGGTSLHGGCVTVVGLFDGYDYKALVRGNNLDRDSLAQEFSRYSFIITFYGSVFDLPYLRSLYGLEFTMPHFDLCFSGRKAGFRGGLKKIEAGLGIQRDETVRRFDGFDAVRLWQEVQRGSSEALELLLAYNRCDTVNLFRLADTIYERLFSQTGIADCIAGFKRFT